MLRRKKTQVLRRKKSSFLFAAVVLLFSSQCQTQGLPKIEGNIEVAEGWKPVVYAVQPRSFKEIAASFSGLVLDSASIAPDGSFAFSNLPPIADLTLIQLCVQKVGGRFPNQLQDEPPNLSNYMPIVIKNGIAVEITANAGAFQATFSIKNPSAENAAMLQLRDIRHAAYLQQRDLLEAQDSHDDEAMLLDQETA